MTALVPIFAGKDDAPPHVVLDSDEQGLLFAKKLREGPIYAGPYSERIHNVGDLGLSFENAEVEDIVPRDIIVGVISRMFRGGDVDFEDVARKDQPIVPQIQAFASSNGITLGPGWKVDLARAAKQKLVANPDKIPDETIGLWVKLFRLFV